MDKKEAMLKQRDEAKKKAAQYENQVKPCGSWRMSGWWKRN